MNCRASPCGIVLLNYSDLRCLYRRAMFLQVDRFISAHPLFFMSATYYIRMNIIRRIYINIRLIFFDNAY